MGTYLHGGYAPPPPPRQPTFFEQFMQGFMQGQQLNAAQKEQDNAQQERQLHLEALKHEQNRLKFEQNRIKLEDKIKAQQMNREGALQNLQFNRGITPPVDALPNDMMGPATMRTQSSMQIPGISAPEAGINIPGLEAPVLYAPDVEQQKAEDAQREALLAAAKARMTSQATAEGQATVAQRPREVPGMPGSQVPGDLVDNILSMMTQQAQQRGSQAFTAAQQKDQQAFTAGENAQNRTATAANARLAVQNRPPSEGERTAFTYYRRAADAEQALQQVEPAIAATGVAGQARLQLPTFLQSDEGKLYTQAQRQFTEARLRKDSGAAISNAEYAKDAQTYFAQPGDTEAVRARKAQARAVVLSGLKSASGRAYEETFGAQSGQPVGARPGAAPNLSGGGPVRVSSPAEAARLPRGTQFIDPNGVVRTVP